MPWYAMVCHGLCHPQDSNSCGQHHQAFEAHAEACMGHGAKATKVAVPPIVFFGKTQPQPNIARPATFEGWLLMHTYVFLPTSSLARKKCTDCTVTWYALTPMDEQDVVRTPISCFSHERMWPHVSMPRIGLLLGTTDHVVFHRFDGFPVGENR